MKQLVTEISGSKWREIPENIIALLREGDTPAFRAYSEEVRWRWFAGSHRQPEPDHCEKVRRLLRAQVEAFLNTGQDPGWIMANREIDSLLRRSQPKPVVHMRFHRTPIEILHEFPKRLRPQMEATRLLLVLLSSPEARQMRHCVQCANVFIGRPQKKFCSRACLEKNFASSKAFQKKRKNYMKRRRKDAADEIVDWAGATTLNGAQLVNMLNDRLKARQVENQPIESVTGNWITRHRKEIEKRRRGKCAESTVVCFRIEKHGGLSSGTPTTSAAGRK